MNTETSSPTVNQEGFIGRELFDHKNNKFNRECVEVKTVDLRASDNAHHKYIITVWKHPEPGPNAGVESSTPVSTCEINFQNGGLREVGPNGITDQALLSIVLDRLRSFNEGPYRCRENSMQITKIEEALMWGRKRADDRAMRGVEGERLQ